MPVAPAESLQFSPPEAVQRLAVLTWPVGNAVGGDPVRAGRPSAAAAELPDRSSNTWSAPIQGSTRLHVQRLVLVAVDTDCRTADSWSLSPPSTTDLEAADPLTRASTGGTTQVLHTEVSGTALLLDEAPRAGVQRVVMLSSVDGFSCFMGQGRPEYLPSTTCTDQAARRLCLVQACSRGAV